MAEKAILFDTTRCIACRACQVACKQWWELPAESTINRGTYENPPVLSASTWNRLRFRETSVNGKINWLFTRHACMHCSSAVCVWVCPTFARTYEENGSVTIDRERCIGCGRCEEFCPFKAPVLGRHNISPRIAVELGTPRQVAFKCVLCKDRLEDGLTPSCVKTCPPGALQFGDREGLVAKGKARVNAIKAAHPKASLYGETELNGLHVMYVLMEKPAVHGLPENPQVEDYPLYDENTFPDWYVRAVADGKLPAFPPNAKPEWYLQPKLVPVPAPPEPAFPAAVSRIIPSWSQPALWSWLGVGVIGGAVAIGWTIKRRNGMKDHKKT
ncbi:MAG: 4Fe-4S dicluster domain-containing protein [Dehalococcoidia bacterium]|nr:4Fe-4S dicluster domain-containing protein [Dehalococcoidia bacterium]